LELPNRWSFHANQSSGSDDAARHHGFANGGAGTRHRARRTDRPRFRTYVVEQRLPSYRYEQPFVVGAVLPESGLTYYDIPGEYHVRGYRYAYVNDHAVLVDQHTRQIVQIID
jgi:Protein of unknown function (DUF1236)